MNENSVTLHTKTLKEVFEEMDLQIPDYQRAYEWKTENVKNLLKDTYEIFLKNKPYLMGTLICHQNGKNFDIVDGQQRLITLSILLNSLDEKISTSLMDSKFDNIKSFYYIKNTKKEIDSFRKGKLAEQQKLYLEYLQNKLSFSVLIVSGNNALDQAYTFFDSLNSKGKSLSDFDLLKAHHLMFIPEKQESLARDHNDFWQAKDEVHFALFDQILRRIRMWSRGSDRDSKADRNDYYEFISAVEPSELEQTEHHFNCYMQPNVFFSWRRENDEIVVLNKKYSSQKNMEEFLPIEIPQTIEGGDAFFLYAKRYHKLYEFLFEKKLEKQSWEIQFVHQLAKSITNEKLTMAFKAVMLLYYDKFGENKIIEVATCAEMIISKFRFDSKAIRIEGTLSHIKNNDLIPIILNSTIASHVVNLMLEKIYIQKKITLENSPTITHYLSIIKSFYQDNKSKIINKLIVEKLENIYKN